MKTEYWKIQDVFLERMKHDYESGLITNPVYKPYFAWKFYGKPINSFTRRICFRIMKESQKELEILDNKYPDANKQFLTDPTLDNVWIQYEGYGKDKYLYSYLLGIENEITKIMMAI